MKDATEKGFMDAQLTIDDVVKWASMADSFYCCVLYKKLIRAASLVRRQMSWTECRVASAELILESEGVPTPPPGEETT